MAYEQLTRGDLIRLLEQHDAERAEAGKDGIIMSYTGRTAPWQIIRQVKPKLTKINQRASVGDAQAQGQNIIMDGENLSAMVTLYKYRGQVDLILTDPPYNTGEDFRYNDKWDKDPNDPELGDVVPKEDGSRHSKWLRFMTPRIWMMREMLKPGGVIAICIDHRELYRLGMLMDEVFREENRIGIINWQKAFSPKNDSKHLSTGTEYVLVYAKDIAKSKTGLLPRDEKSDRFFGNIDNDPLGDWSGKDPTAREARKNTVYGVQSPFTGTLHYPDFEHKFSGPVQPASMHWRMTRTEMKQCLAGWDVKYEERDLGDGRGKAFVLAGCGIQLQDYDPEADPVVQKAKKKAFARLEKGNWPKLYFRDDRSGNRAVGRPRIKNYMSAVKRGKVAMTYWADEDYETPLTIDSQSWDHAESGHSKAGIDELDSVVGKGHNFTTVKPLKLMKKIIHLWSGPNSIVMDPFAGSGTTAHAVLDLNKEAGASRRFILVEQGNDEKGDHYAKSLTADRIRRVIKGDWKTGQREPLGGGFQFIELKRQQVDAAAVNALQREEMIDLLLTSHWEKSDRAKTSLTRFVPEVNRRFLFATNARNEGFFLIWDGADQPSILNRETFKAIVEEARAYGLMDRYHVYASLAPYSGRTVEFYKIPDRVLEHIGFNTRADAYNNETENEQG